MSEIIHNENNIECIFSFESENSTSDLEIIDKKKKETEIEDRKYRIIESINKTLEKLINKKKKKKNTINELTAIFFSETIPEISVLDYLIRIIKYTYCEESTMILGLIYLDRICLKNILISKYNIHKLLFVSILLAIKNNEDQIYKNDYYCEVSGINLSDLCLMEYNFAILLNFNFYVNDYEYNLYKNAIDMNIL